MKRYIHHKVTSWVAIVIIAAISSTFVYFIWINANESWGYDYVYPKFNKKVSNLLTNIETLGWKTYNDQGYGFEISHPAKYSKTVSTIVSNSVLNVPATSVGPLVFIKADTQDLKNAANAKFNHYWNLPGKLESPKNYCKKENLERETFDMRIVFCLINGKEERYALIKGKSFDIFVDGSTESKDSTLKEAYGDAVKAISQTEFIQVLSTFKFIES